MRFKKFIIIPILIVAYVFFINRIVQYNPSIGTSSPGGVGGGGEQVIGVGATVTVSVTRPYLFGLIRLPIYTGALGDISGIHNFFFKFIIGLTIIFILIEIIQWRRKEKWPKMVRIGKKYLKR